MDVDLSALPDDVAALKAAVIAACAKADAMAAELANEQAKRADDAALIAHMKLQIEKLKRDKFGPSAERSSRLLDQMAFELEELEAGATEDELAAERAAAKTSTVAPFTRNRPARKPFPDHLPRERVIVPGPTACTCCGSARLARLGETITETLETIPRSWKVIQHVREKFTCRDCEKISQVPAPFHVIPRGWAGPSFLAMLVFEKFGQHQPLNRQAERYAREGVPLSLSTLADQVGACCAVLEPLFNLLVAHVFVGERIQAMTPPSRCWLRACPGLDPGAKPTSPAPGSMSAMTAPSAVRRHRQLCSIIPATVPANIHKATWPDILEFSRPMLLADTTNSMRPVALQGRSSKQPVGLTPGANSSSWPTSQNWPHERPRAKSPCSHRPRPSK